jgi:hypothetical protein
MKAVDSIFMRCQRREKTTQVKPPRAQPALVHSRASYCGTSAFQQRQFACLALPFSRVRQLSEPAEVYHILASELLCLPGELR